MSQEKMNNFNWNTYYNNQKKDPLMKELLESVEHSVAIGTIIYRARIAKDLSQEQLARIVRTSQSHISRLEQAGYRSHTTKTLEKIAKALDLKPSFAFDPNVTQTTEAEYDYKTDPSESKQTVTWHFFQQKDQSLHEAQSSAFAMIAISQLSNQEYNYRGAYA